MRLAAIEFCGFRGTRRRVRLEIPAGFLVITGRNGAGKSTVCDAIEFALTGEIRGGTSHKEKGENVGDYVWWRGRERANDRYVEVTFEADSGQQHSVRRTPEGVPSTSLELLKAKLCTDIEGLDDPLRQICRTAVLRDEEITRLSVDLKETDRFDFVRSVLGTAAFSVVEGRATELFRMAKSRAEETAKDYLLARDRVNQATARLSALRSQVGSPDSAEESRMELVRLVGGGSDRFDLVSKGSQLARDARRRADVLLGSYASLRELVSGNKEVSSDAFQSTVKGRLAALAMAKQELEEAIQRSLQAKAEVDQAESLRPKLTGLAQLVEFAQRYGLEDGHCPLCAAPQSAEDFQRRLHARVVQIAATSEAVTAAVREHRERAEIVAQHQSQVERLELEVEQLRSRSAAFVATLEALRQDLASVGYTLGDASPAEVMQLSEAAEEARETATNLDRSLVAVRWVADTSKVEVSQKEVEELRQQCAEMERRHASASVAADRAKAALDGVRRARGETVDERMAELSPLLTELYQRLRPCADYPEVSYRLRGDVRRMLSFEVGDGLNPSFLFSSGQRRAAGLAFLLAIHLSRRWCALESLVLDDPVQHIDDYRALHLVEVLAAIRKAGRQVVCTVEDPALADLLTRRLRSNAETSGGLATMEYIPGEGTQVSSMRSISGVGGPTVLIA